MLSIVLPAYNENVNIMKAYHAIKKIMENAEIPAELVYVNDGSKDNTWEEICTAAKLAKKEKSDAIQVKGINFSVILVKRQLFWQALPTHQGRLALLWTAICSIHRKLWWKCTAFGSRDMR